MLLELIVFGVFTCVFILFGGLLMKGHGAYLIAGFNTLPKEEQAKYDVPALTKFMGKLMFVIAFSMIVFMVGAIFEMEAFFVVGTIIILVTVIFMVLYTNTKDRFKKPQRDED